MSQDRSDDEDLMRALHHEAVQAIFAYEEALGPVGDPRRHLAFLARAKLNEAEGARRNEKVRTR